MTTIDKIQKKNRSFKVKLSEEGELYGRYNGDSPYQAANKALSEIIRNKVRDNQNITNDINFYLVESTKGSSKKIHQYFGKRIKLDLPVEYKVGDQVIIKNYKNILKKVKQGPKTTKKVAAKVTTVKAAKKVAAKKVTKVVAAKTPALKVATKKVAAKKVAAKTVAAKKVTA